LISIQAIYRRWLAPIMADVDSADAAVHTLPDGRHRASATCATRFYCASSGRFFAGAYTGSTAVDERNGVIGDDPS